MPVTTIRRGRWSASVRRDCRLRATLDGSQLTERVDDQFEQFARSQYLVTQGFQLVAEDKLTPEQWKKYRNFATRNVQELAEGALKSIRAGKASGESDG